MIWVGEQQHHMEASMRLRYLRYFLAVAEELSFTHAAARVHIEPSPLSRAIREMESSLEVHLLQRRQGRIQLTRAGEVFREEARRLVAFMESARARVRSAEQGGRGPLRIGLADHLVQPSLIRLLARCREEEPLTPVRIVEMSVDEMVRALEDERIDAGFTVHPEPNEALRKEIAWRDRFAIALPRNHPLLAHSRIPLREITRYPLLLFHPESCPGGYDLLRRWLFSTAPSPRIAEYVSGHDVMMMLAAAGYGIGVGLESQIALYRHPGVIVRPAAHDAPATATFLLTPDRPLSNELSRFVRRVRQIGPLGLFSSAD
jgi:DNA-binding transcriptional LysR family regulator